MVRIQAYSKSLKKKKEILQSHPASFDGIGLTDPHLELEIEESFLAAAG